MTGLTKTTTPLKPTEIEKRWIVIDADGAVVGRLASFIATRLRGKHRPDYTPHVDCGDYVVVVNADKVRLTGKKLENKLYHWHTGHPGGLKRRTAGEILSGAHPERVLQKAVERMLPKESSLARRQMRHLRIYVGAEHPHVAQEPHPVAFGDLNPKNTIGTARRVAGHALSNRGGGEFIDLDALRAEAIAGGKEQDPGWLVHEKDLEAIAGKIDRLLLDLDHNEMPARRKALLQLAALLPKLDVASSLAFEPLRQALRSIPDRLVQALAENLISAETAKAAALAIAACVRPEHYRTLAVADNEDQALADLEKVFAACRIDSFSTVKLDPPRPGRTVVEAQLWDGLPFTLAGRKPQLVSAPWLTDRGGLGIELYGAEAVEVETVDSGSLSDGQVAGVRAVLKRTPDTEDNVVLYLTHGDRIFDRYVYDSEALFQLEGA